jgi:hypothetical protein
MIKTLGRALPLILAALSLSLTAAQAQTLPWPDAAGKAGPAAPAPMIAAPPSAAPAPSGAQEQCFNEFNALRSNVEKLGKAARAAGERKVPREELCRHVSAFAAAEGKWIKFTSDNVTRCGIPPQIPKQLREQHNNTLTARKNICATAPAAAAGPAAPSLSDALGTSRMPLRDGSHSGRGTLDTLTGNAIAR